MQANANHPVPWSPPLQNRTILVRVTNCLLHVPLSPRASFGINLAATSSVDVVMRLTTTSSAPPPRGENTSTEMELGTQRYAVRWVEGGEKTNEVTCIKMHSRHAMNLLNIVVILFKDKCDCVITSNKRLRLYKPVSIDELIFFLEF